MTGIQAKSGRWIVATHPRQFPPKSKGVCAAFLRIAYALPGVFGQSPPYIFVHVANHRVHMFILKEMASPFQNSVGDRNPFLFMQFVYQIHSVRGRRNPVPGSIDDKSGGRARCQKRKIIHVCGRRHADKPRNLWPTHQQLHAGISQYVFCIQSVLVQKILPLVHRKNPPVLVSLKFVPF